MPTGPESQKRPAPKLGAEKTAPEERHRRFVEVARDLDCDKSEERFDTALEVIGRAKPKASEAGSHLWKAKSDKANR